MNLRLSSPNRAAALTCTLALCFAPALSAQDLLWSEEFDLGSQPNPNTWSYDLGTGTDGWGNLELQTYTDSTANAAIENGELVITARATMNGNDVAGFTSARIRTQDKLMVKYGRIEARIKVPNLHRGLWPAFWTLGNNFSSVGWPDAGEIDIMEMGSYDAIVNNRTNREVGSTAHWENLGQHAFYGLSLVANQDLNNDYHLFTLDWTPSSLITYLDGQKIWEMDITPGNCTDCTEFHAPHFLILNMAVGGTYTQMRSIGSITAPLPAEMRVDYIRIYDNGFTELSGSTLGSPDIGPAHSGSWYNADQSGHGFSVEFGELPDGTPLAVIYWYTYNDQGDPIFMLGTGTPEGNQVTVEFQSPVGMVYGVFDRETVSRPDGGTGVFVFEDRDNATFSYTPSEFSTSTWGHATPIDNLPLTKLFGIPAEAAFSGTGGE